jgi:hypothetical protein
MHPTDSHLFEAIALRMPGAVIFADRDGIIQVWTEAPRPCSVSPRMRLSAAASSVRRADGRTLSGNQVRTTRSIHKDGRKLYVDLSFDFIINEAGAVAGAVVVGRDCSERYMAERALREQLAAFEASRPAS